MKRFKFFIISVLSLVIQVSSAQDKLVLNGYVKGYQGKTRLILNFIKPNHEADMENETELYMIDGKFKIESQLDEPALLSIRIRPEIMTDKINPASFESAFIWVDNKEMTLVGEKGSFEYCDVTGYSRQDENEKSKRYVRNRMNHYQNTLDSLSTNQSKEAIKKRNQLRSVSPVYLQNKYLLDYSIKNPNSFVSVYNYSWFVKWLPEMVPKSHAIAFYNSLQDDLKNTSPGMQIKHYIDHIAVNRKLNIGDRPYEFSLRDSTGQEIPLTSLKGKVVLLDFWSSSCGPCRREHQNYIQLYHEFHGKGFEIFSVSMDRNKETWKKAMAKDQITWPSVWDETMEISKYRYLVSAIPQNYLISRNGTIIAINTKGTELKDSLTELFNQK